MQLFKIILVHLYTLNLKKDMNTINNMEQLVNEVYRQLQDKNYYMENYTLLESVDLYLQDYKKEGGSLDTEKEIKEQIHNFFEYDYAGTLTDFPSAI